jgi:hypothetical protein
MEFASRKECIEHYQDQFPNLPRYMIEMALDYDLAQGDGSASNEKPLTGKQKRQQKQVKKTQEPVKRELNETIQDALETGKSLEIDCAQVVKAEEYEMPPFIKGHIEVDGSKLAQAAAQEEPLEEIGFDEDF